MQGLDRAAEGARGVAQGRGLVGPVREEACEAVRDAMLEHSDQFFLASARRRTVCCWCSSARPSFATGVEPTWIVGRKAVSVLGGRMTTKTLIRVRGERVTSGSDSHFASGQGKNPFPYSGRGAVYATLWRHLRIHGMEGEAGPCRPGGGGFTRIRESKRRRLRASCPAVRWFMIYLCSCAAFPGVPRHSSATSSEFRTAVSSYG